MIPQSSILTLPDAAREFRISKSLLNRIRRGKCPHVPPFPNFTLAVASGFDARPSVNGFWSLNSNGRRSPIQAVSSGASSETKNLSISGEPEEVMCSTIIARLKGTTALAN